MRDTIKWEVVSRPPLEIIIARSPEQKAQGLQGIKKLPKNTIMFFPNMNPNSYFHTINCFFPIDIVCVNKLGAVIQTWSAYPGQKAIGPTPTGTVAVAEGPLGWAEGFRTGDILPFLR